MSYLIKRKLNLWKKMWIVLDLFAANCTEEEVEVIVLASSREELAEPSEALLIATALCYAAHEQFYSVSAWVSRCRVLSVGHARWQAKNIAKLFLAERILSIDFVAQDEKGHVLELGHPNEFVQFFLSFIETLAIGRINQEDYCIGRLNILMPDLPSCEMSAQIEQVIANISHRDR